MALQDITGLLLAGGQGARMGGQDKGLLLLRGEPLARHVLRRLQPQVGRVAISANRHAVAYAAMGCEVWPDGPGEASFDGPLAGLLSGLSHCATEWLATAPCDTPGLPLDLVARLADAAAQRGALLASASTLDAAGAPRAQPVCSLVHCSLRPALAAYLAAGHRRVRQWQAQVGGVDVLFGDAGAFDNVNTPEDLARLERGPSPADRNVAG